MKNNDMKTDDFIFVTINIEDKNTIFKLKRKDIPVILEQKPNVHRVRVRVRACAVLGKNDFEMVLIFVMS